MILFYIDFFNSNYFRFVDVGGSYYHRMKWMTHFDDVTSVIFVCSLSGGFNIDNFF